MGSADTTSAPVNRPGESSGGQVEQCEQCGAPVETMQRYCVNCGAHRPHVHDPAATHLAAVTSRSRTAVPARSAPRSGRSAGLGTALVLAVIPLAVGLGVLVGRMSTNGDGKLVAALRAQKPEIINTGTGRAAGNAGSRQTSLARQSAASLTSTFPLQSGYSIELQTLAPHGTDQQTVSRAEHDAEAKGAKAVGLIAQSDFRVTPSPPHGAYVIYSGAFKARSDAERALARLTRKFSSAKVIQVQAAAGTAPGAGKVLTKSVYGTAHQITGFKATSSSLAAGRKVVERVQKEAGKSYVNSQRGLPDVISVP